MIKQFKFKNLYSFKDETVISFAKKEKLKESEEYILKKEKNQFIKFVTIYGKNNVGKTNLLKAIQSFYFFVNQNSLMGFKLSSVYKNWYFFSSSNELEPIEFEIIFTNDIENDCYEYRYGFSFDENEILTEYLFLKINGKAEVKVFDKNIENKSDIEKIINTKIFTSSPGLFVNLPKTKLILLIAANINEKNSVMVATSIINKNLNINVDSNYEVFDLSLGRLKQNQIEEITNFINDIDISIDKIIIKDQIIPNTNPFSNNENNKVKLPYFSINNNEIPLNRISLGSKKIINYFSFIMDMINRFLDLNESTNLENFLLTIDEFDSGLHPNILVNLIKEILNKIDKLGFGDKIQLLITTHNPLLLGDKNLRRDQVIFVEKDDKYHCSYIEELGEKSIRKDLNLVKSFIEGKLGGVPNIKIISDEEIDEIIKDKLKNALRDDKKFNEIMEKLANS